MSESLIIEFRCFHSYFFKIDRCESFLEKVTSNYYYPLCEPPPWFQTESSPSIQRSYAMHATVLQGTEIFIRVHSAVHCGSKIGRFLIPGGLTLLED